MNSIVATGAIIGRVFAKEFNSAVSFLALFASLGVRVSESESETRARASVSASVSVRRVSKRVGVLDLNFARVLGLAKLDYSHRNSIIILLCWCMIMTMTMSLSL